MDVYQRRENLRFYGAEERESEEVGSIEYWFTLIRPDKELCLRISFPCLADVFFQGPFPLEIPSGYMSG